MNVYYLAQLLEAKVLCMPKGENVITGCQAGDLLSHVMANAVSKSVWVTVMANKNVPAVALFGDISCVIIADGVMPEAEVIDAAQEHGINLLSVSDTMYEVCVKLDKLLHGNENVK